MLIEVLHKSLAFGDTGEEVNKMNKLNKNFNSNGFTVESMACTLTCSCKCSMPSCSCTTTSDYYAYVNLTSNTAATYNAVDYEVYEMHYLG